MGMSREERAKRRRQRGSTARERAETFNDGMTSSCLIVPPGLKLWKPDEGLHEVSIVPYFAGEGNPQVEPGVEHYERTFYVYKEIGPEKKWFVARTKLNLPDFMQRMKAQCADDPSYDKDAMKIFIPAIRQLYLIYDHNDPDTGLQLWDVSWHNFGKLLERRIRTAPESRGWDFFYSPETDGKILAIDIGTDSGGSFTFKKAIAIDFVDRDEPLPDEIIDHSYVLDDMLRIPEDSEVEAAWYGVAAGDDHDDDDGDKSPASTQRTTRRPPKPEPEPEKTEPRTRRRRDDKGDPVDTKTETKRETKTKQETKRDSIKEDLKASDAGIEIGTRVRWKGGEWEVMKISRDQTSLVLSNDDDDVEKAIGCAEVEVLGSVEPEPEPEPEPNDEEPPFEATDEEKAPAETVADSEFGEWD